MEIPRVLSRRKMMNLRMTLCCLTLLIAVPCHAYVGPGLGAGVLTAIAGIVVSVLAAILAVVYYPIKRALRKKKKSNRDEENDDKQEQREPGDADQGET